MINRCDDCGNFMKDREHDDLDLAETYLRNADNNSNGEAAVLAALASASIQLWYAKQNREYQQAVAKQRQAQQSMPVPTPAMPYPGAF